MTRAQGGEVDGHAAMDWSYADATIERVRAAAPRPKDTSDLLAVLRAYAWHSDGATGANAYPSLRTVADLVAVSRNRVAGLVDVLVAAGLLVDTGERRGRGRAGGAVVYTLPIGTPCGANSSGGQLAPTAPELAPTRPELALHAVPDQGPVTSTPQPPKGGNGNGRRRRQRDSGDYGGRNPPQAPSDDEQQALLDLANAKLDRWAATPPNERTP
jgi:hypothetical protein